MIKFDLEKALAGDKVVTRDGRDAVDGYYFKSITDGFPVLFIVAGERIWVNTHGRRQALDVDDNLDLFMAPKKLSGFVNVFSREKGNFFISQHDSKESAKENNTAHAFFISHRNF